MQTSEDNDVSLERSLSLEVEVKVKFWLKLREGNRNFSFGPGDYRLLKALQETENLTKSSKACGYSYKYAWTKLRKLSRNSGHEIAISTKGGSGGGGHVILTDWGRYLLECFSRAKEEIEKNIDSLNAQLHETPFVKRVEKTKKN